MAIRVCPVCGKEVPASLTVAYSNGLECPHCHSRDEVVESSRMLPIWLGLAAGFLVYHFTGNVGGPVGFALPELYSILTFGVVTPLAMMFTAKLEPAPAAPVAAPSAPAAHGHH